MALASVTVLVVSGILGYRFVLCREKAIVASMVTVVVVVGGI